MTFLSGLALEYISPETLRKALSGKNGFVGQVIAMFLGYVTPFCSCSTVPVLASMIKAGIPIAVMTTFLYASPYHVEIAVPILAPLFGVPPALAFLIADGLLALLGGFIVARLGWQNQVKIQTAGVGGMGAPVSGSLPMIQLDDTF